MATNQTKKISHFSDVAEDLAQVEAVITETLQADEELAFQVSAQLLQAGGKRIRPAILLLSGRFYNYDLGKLAPVAAAIELIHMATLVHDDVVDRSLVRRGRPTINASWGSEVSVLIGDYLFAKAFGLLSAQGDNRVVRIASQVVFEMSTGELSQLSRAFNCDLGQADYLRRIDKKTALFIAESCHLGALISGAPDQACGALRDYGYGVGMGFQIVDDILDFTASPASMGKPVGSDLRSGVITLPVIHALGNSPEGRRLREIIETKVIGDAEITEATGIIQRAGSLDYALGIARRYIESAKNRLPGLPDVPARGTLSMLADFIITRDH